MCLCNVASSQAMYKRWLIKPCNMLEREEDQYCYFIGGEDEVQRLKPALKMNDALQRVFEHSA